MDDRRLISQNGVLYGEGLEMLNRLGKIIHHPPAHFMCRLSHLKQSVIVYFFIPVSAVVIPKPTYTKSNNSSLTTDDA